MDCPDEDELVAFAEHLLGPEHRARVDRHIQACPICAGLVAEAARADRTSTASDGAVLVDPPALGRGSVLGRYLVLEALGEGGLGRVFSAFDADLDRKIAIKVLRSEVLRDDERRARLLREAQALARVRHPNVVAVHDVGSHEGHIWIAMELVEGRTLRAWMDEDTHGWAEIRDVFVAAGQGLAAVHEAGLVHRDFKPANVLVGPQGRVQVADFGLARDLGAAVDVDPVAPPSASTSSLRRVLTRVGTVLGTPAYMAPEQHRGRDVDARADQFSFCVALHEALWGVRPFAGADTQALLEAIDRGQRVEVPPRVVPRWLERAVLRGLAADPEQRFPDLERLLAVLREDRRRTRRSSLLVASLSLVLGAASWAMAVGPVFALDPIAVTQVEAIVAAARAAAAEHAFVYPPATEPEAVTAYERIVELERMHDAGYARGRARELRAEIAGVLVGLGDHYWEQPGGAPFAADYYASALLFDDTIERARERCMLPPAALATLADKAARRAHSPLELVAVAPLAALAFDDPRAQRSEIADLYAHEPEPPASTTASLERLLGPAATEAIAEGRARRTQATPAVVAVHTPDAASVAAIAMPAEASTSEKSDRELAAPDSAREDAPSPKAAPSDPESAREWAKQGRLALARGALAEAETAFNRALAADRRHVPALTGLGEVHFQRQSHGAAARVLERASALDPDDGEIRIRLGDAYFKVLRYRDAEAQYELAADHDHPLAARRLERLHERMGGEP